MTFHDSESNREGGGTRWCPRLRQAKPALAAPRLPSPHAATRRAGRSGHALRACRSQTRAILAPASDFAPVQGAVRRCPSIRGRPPGETRMDLRRILGIVAVIVGSIAGRMVARAA